MKVNLYAVLDTASRVYDGPVPAQTDEVAIRNFSNMAMNADSPIGRNPEHFMLFKVGAWDDSRGEVEADVIECICKAIDVVNKVTPIGEAADA